MDGRNWVTGPLAEAQLRTLRPAMKAVADAYGEWSGRHLATMVETAHALLAANYPDLRRASIKNMLELRHVVPLMREIERQALGLRTPGLHEPKRSE